MGLIKVIFSCIIQGITEFLAIISSGHLIMFQQILGLVQGELTLDSFLHFGTVVSILIICNDVLDMFY